MQRDLHVGVRDPRWTRARGSPPDRSARDAFTARSILAGESTVSANEDLAEEVADTLMRRSPLKAAPESEQGIVRLTSCPDLVISGVGSALAFGLGGALSRAIAWYVTMSIETGVIVVSVLVSLSLISGVGVRVGRMNVSRTTPVDASMTILLR